MGAIRQGPDRLSVFVATPGWSRAACAEFVADRRLETPLAGREHAFLFFDRGPVFHAAFRALADHHSFVRGFPSALC